MVNLLRSEFVFPYFITSTDYSLAQQKLTIDIKIRFFHQTEILLLFKNWILYSFGVMPAIFLKSCVK